jgi:two-component system phosphate regulon response regulator PhoB
MLGSLSQTAARILLVEDDPSRDGSLCFGLEAAGHRVGVASTGAEALRLFSEFGPDLVLLDIVLPDISGLDICRMIRATPYRAQPAIIVVTAKAQEVDRIAAFEAGADDFVAKPFSFGELMLRIHARLQGRSQVEAAPAPKEPEPVEETDQRIILGALEIDRASHRVFLANSEVRLSVQEMRLLNYLADEPGVMRSRRDLLTAVWGYHPEASSRTLDTHIKRLRDKFGSYASMIQTVHGVGYRLTTAMHRTRVADTPKPAHRRR